MQLKIAVTLSRPLSEGLIFVRFFDKTECLLILTLRGTP